MAPRKSKIPIPPASALDTIITTHINADFDALASMLAAQKLYPGARVVFPGSQEKNLRNFFIQSMVYLFNITEIRDIDFDSIERLVLVDTRRRERIGRIAEILQNPDLEVHIFDHHSSKEDDIQGKILVQRKTGATVTILTEILRHRKIPITPEEATIMCLGIYEDTGSFTFNSTTPEDLEAAAYLISMGANLNVVSSLIAREISSEQIVQLNDLIQAAMHHTINGVDIVVTSITLDYYMPDFAFLIHKMIKMEEMNAIFALAMMESKVYLVARSRSTDVDVGVIAGTLGGGGHPSAAAATIKGKTLTQVEQLLFRQLERHIRPQRRARQLMSTPAITAAETISCHEANKLLTRYNINALLVTAQEDPALVGYITRQVIEKAIHHDLGGSPVRDYMSTEMVTATADADLPEIQDKIIGHKQRILPVLDRDRLVGVITRTDLLHVLVQQTRFMPKDAPDPGKLPLPARLRDINNFMQERIPGQLMHTLRRIGETAAHLAFQAYVVGGFVRDLFLYRRNEDVDIVIEGDGIAFARAYAQKYGARIHTHKVFGTAVIIFEDGFKIDVATARMEYYRSPAALPDVEMSSIKMDLFRRDFTINTLAIHLNPNRFGKLIDFFSAQKDLKDKAVRVLHNLSFVEDPTRVFRAVRFEQRFGFTIGKLTASLIQNAVKMDFFKRLSGRRFFTEIRLILEEENPTPAIVRLNDFDLLPAIHPSIEMDQRLIDLLNAAKRAVAWHDLLFIEAPFQRWAVYLMALIHPCDADTAYQVCLNLELSPRTHRLLCRDRFEALKCLNQLEYRLPESNSTLYHLLHPFRTELILYMIAVTRHTTVKKAISRYYTQLREITPEIKGQDLVGAGLKPGPQFRDILDAVLDARLNGELESREDELAFVARWIRNDNFLDSRPPNQ